MGPWVEDSLTHRNFLRTVGVALGFAVLQRSGLCQAQVTIQVLSRPHLSATAQCASSGTECLVKGKLTDDLEFPLSNHTVYAVLMPGPMPPSVVGTLNPCEALEIAAKAQPNQPALAHTNESGEFCFRCEMSAPHNDARVKINTLGGVGYEPVEGQFLLTRADTLSTLRVHESPDRIALESASVAISVELVGLGEAATSQPITLALREPAFREPQSKKNLISTATTDASGIAHFTLPGRRFGTPGMAHLVASFEGSKEVPPATLTWQILRTCRVNIETRIEAVDVAVGDLANVLAVATTACGSVPEGSIEFFLGQDSQVTLPLIHGQSNWQLSTFQFSPGQFSIGSRYVAASAAWSGSEVSWAKLRVSPVSGRRRAIWLTSGLLVLAWFALRWRRSDRVNVQRTRGAPPTPRAQSLEVLPSTNPNSDWEGIVIDSHTGVPIAGAIVSIEQPGFSETRVLRQAETMLDGTFTLLHAESSRRATLAVVAAKYSRAQWSMPRPGNLVVRLETRRRAIVRSLVAWADTLRHDDKSGSEPTPAEVAHAARRQSLTHIDSWANRVESAAFGPDEPSPTDDELLIPPDGTTIGSNRPQ
jgi:hypothetical protein